MSLYILYKLPILHLYVETLFGQYKYAAGGKLDASNYSTARAACQVKTAVSGHHSGKGYRDDHLYTEPPMLEKKKYKKNTDS